MTAIFSRLIATAVILRLRSTPPTTSLSRRQKTNPAMSCLRSLADIIGEPGRGLYLCYDCLKKAKRPAKVQPFPGVLDHRTFTRTKVELGRWDVCGTGKDFEHRQVRLTTRAPPGCNEPKGRGSRIRLHPPQADRDQPPGRTAPRLLRPRRRPGGVHLRPVPF